MNWLFKAYTSLQLREAIRKADMAHMSNGARYFVIPSSLEVGELYIMDRETFRALKRKHYIKSTASVDNLLRECFYCTPCRGGIFALSAADLRFKRELYFHWCVARRDYRKRHIQQLHGIRRLLYLLRPW